MKKLNNKGMTLIELVVSFAIVSVAIIYFYQTISTVSKLYVNARDDTNNYAETAYVLRLVDAKLDAIKKDHHSPSGKNVDLTNDADINDLKDFCGEIGAECEVSQPSHDPNDDNYHFYKIAVTINNNIKKYLYRRATIKANIGTKTETYEKRADAVDVSKADKAEENYGITFSKSGASMVGNPTWNTGSVDCEAADTICEISEGTDGNVNYERRNHRIIEEQETINLTKISVWRTFRPCTGYNYVPTTEYNKKYYGTFTATGCTNNLSIPELKSGMYVASVVTGNWTEQSVFRCQGVLHNILDVNCNDDTKEQNSLNVNRNIKTDWLTSTGRNHRFVNSGNKYTGSSYLWRIDEVTPIGISWNLSGAAKIKITRFRVVADTYGIYKRTYNVYSYED